MSASASTIKARSMPDILASHKEDDHLRDIRGMVPDSLEMLGNEN
jgi:hypothetical protein